MTSEVTSALGRAESVEMAVVTSTGPVNRVRLVWRSIVKGSKYTTTVLGRRRCDESRRDRALNLSWVRVSIGHKQEAGGQTVANLRDHGGCGKRARSR